MEKKKETLEGLMALALAGDKNAYSDVLTQTSHFLRSYIKKHVFEDSMGEDLVQEILISIHKARHTYDGQRPYKPWAFAIARYRLYDYLRSHYKNPLQKAAQIDDYELFSPLNVTEPPFSYELIEREINSLSGKQPMILKLIHKEGYTIKETAHKMGMKESAVKVAAHRAYKILNKRLSNE